MPGIAKRELGQVVCIAVLVLGLSSVPYAAGYLSAAPGTAFGGFVVDLDDCSSHLAKMQQGVWDGWTYRILFTPEDHPGAILNTFYLALGKLSSWLHLSLTQTYQLARSAFGLGLLLAAYLFIAFFTEDRERRLTAFLLVCLSSGLGWLVLLTGSPTLLGISPMDFWLMEAYTFFTVFTFPHTSAAVALLLLFFLLALQYFGTLRSRVFVFSLIPLVALCVIHPFMALPVDVVLAVYWLLKSLVRRRLLGREALAVCAWAMVPVPLIAYYYQALSGDPVFRSWSAQNLLPSPPLVHLALGYGIVLALATMGAVFVVRLRDEGRVFLVAWVSIGLLLMYAPFALQRRMVEGLHVPLCILATFGLFEYLLPAILGSRWLNRIAQWRGYETKRLHQFLVFALVAATVPSTLFLIASSTVRVLQTPRALFYTTYEIEAIDWLALNTERSDTIFASYEMARFIPTRTGNRVFMGHFIETVDVEHKRELASSFFQADTSEGFRRDLLSTYGIHYLFFGPREREMGGFDPSNSAYLTPAHSNPEVFIYRMVD
jgi:hypothetical protein